MNRVRHARTLTELRAQFEHVAERAAGIAGRVDAALLARRPDPERWSAGECVAHLNLSVDPYFRLWRREIDEGSPVRSSHPDRYRLDFWGRVLVWTLEPPPRFRFAAPSAFHPVDVAPIEAVLPGFLERQRAILEVLETVRGLPIDTMKIQSPFDQRVRYSIWSSLCVTAAHERRHLWQAERALD